MPSCNLTVVVDEPTRPRTRGQHVTGEVRVEVDGDCQARLQLTPRWETHGKGNVAKKEYPSYTLFQGQWKAGAVLSYPFDVVLPEDGPPSYRGNVVNVAWYLQARADGPWLVSPKGQAQVVVVPRRALGEAGGGGPEAATIEARPTVVLTESQRTMALLVIGGLAFSCLAPFLGSAVWHTGFHFVLFGGVLGGLGGWGASLQGRKSTALRILGLVLVGAALGVILGPVKRYGGNGFGLVLCGGVLGGTGVFGSLLMRRQGAGAKRLGLCLVSGVLLTTLLLSDLDGNGPHSEKDPYRLLVLGASGLGFGYVFLLVARNRIAGYRLGKVQVLLSATELGGGDKLAVKVRAMPPARAEVSRVVVALKQSERADWGWRWFWLERVAGLARKKSEEQPAPGWLVINSDFDWTMSYDHEVLQQEVAVKPPSHASVFFESDAVLQLPSEAQPSFATPYNVVRWAVDVRIELPGWPDWVESFPVKVIDR